MRIVAAIIACVLLASCERKEFKTLTLAPDDKNSSYLEWETTKRTATLYLYLPRRGALNWEQPINKNFDLIDAAYRKELDRLRGIESRVSAIDGMALTIVAINQLPPLPKYPTAEEINAKVQHVEDCYGQQIEVESELEKRINALEKEARKEHQ